VFITDLENRARELNIFDLTTFFNSALFKSFRMSVDRTRGVIVKTYLTGDQHGIQERGAAV
jgi:hypothetical protein